jgi:hypothetical protein
LSEGADDDMSADERKETKQLEVEAADHYRAGDNARAGELAARALHLAEQNGNGAASARLQKLLGNVAVDRRTWYYGLFAVALYAASWVFAAW